MNRIISTAIILLVVSLGNGPALAAKNTLEKLYSYAGYPYQDLVRRATLVKIVYSQHGDEMTCRAEVTQNEQIWRGQVTSAKRQNFIAEPLRSCLNREEAKILLKKTFE